MTCQHKRKTLVNVEVDYGAAWPSYLPQPERHEVDVCVAWQCDACGAFVLVGEDVDALELLRRDLPRIDTVAWDEAIRGRLARDRPDYAEAAAMRFFAGAVRR